MHMDMDMGCHAHAHAYIGYVFITVAARAPGAPQRPLLSVVTLLAGPPSSFGSG